MIIFESILATYIVTLLLTEYDGPFGVFYRLRKTKYFGALECFVCASVWVSFAVSLLFVSTIAGYVLTVLASSSGAVILNFIVERIRAENG